MKQRKDLYPPPILSIIVLPLQIKCILEDAQADHELHELNIGKDERMEIRKKAEEGKTKK